MIQTLEHGLPRLGWAGVAAEAGFFDQAHLIRDFRLIAGTTPGRYLEETNPLGVVFATGDVASFQSGADRPP